MLYLTREHLGVSEEFWHKNWWVGVVFCADSESDILFCLIIRAVRDKNTILTGYTLGVKISDVVRTRVTISTKATTNKSMIWLYTRDYTYNKRVIRLYYFVFWSLILMIKIWIVGYSSDHAICTPIVYPVKIVVLSLTEKSKNLRTYSFFIWPLSYIIKFLQFLY